MLLAQFYQLEIPHEEIRTWEEPQKKGSKTWALTYWQVRLPQGVGPERITSQLRQSTEEVLTGVTFTTTRATDEAWEVEVKIDGLLAHHLILHPPKLKPPKPRARIAIVVDDLGLDKRIAEELLRLDIPLTFSILPLQPSSRRIAQKAHAQGREIILHLPLEPRGYPVKDPGEGALFVAMGEKELLRHLREDLKAVPYIKGVSNHMGSRFMEQEGHVRLVLQEIKERKLFFFDSFTSSKSEGYQIAQELGMKTGKRDLFLDNETNNVKYIRLQLERLIRIAQTNGTAIGVCHPYPSTITALREMAPTFEEQGVEIVPLSQVLD